MNKKELKQNFNDYMLLKTLKMFKWENLPDTIPVIEIEKLLQCGGKGIFFRNNDKYYFLPFSYANEPNVYNLPSGFIITNIVLGTFEEKLDLSLESENGIIIKNDDLEKGLLPIFNKYGDMVIESEITLKMLSKIARLNTFITVSDDKAKKDSEKFIEQIENGNLATLGNNYLYDSVKTFNNHSGVNEISQFIELVHYLKSSCLNEIGINANYNMKRERINEKEIQLNDYSLLPMCNNMLDCRQQAIEKINKKFNLDIRVSLTDIWEIEKTNIEETTETTQEEREQQEQ